MSQQGMEFQLSAVKMGCKYEPIWKNLHPGFINSVLQLLNSNHKKKRERVKDQKPCLHLEPFQTFSCKFDYVHCPKAPFT